MKKNIANRSLTHDPATRPSERVDSGDETKALGAFRIAELETLNKALKLEIVRLKKKANYDLIYQKRLQSLISRRSLIEEQERRRIATCVHDQVGQSLALTKIRLGSLRKLTANSESAITLELAKVQGSLEKAIQEARDLTVEICPPILYELGFEAAAEWLLERHFSSPGLAYHYESDGLPKPVNEENEIIAFQSLRELFVNITKHANARSVWLSVKKKDGYASVELVDDGAGFDVEKTLSLSHATRGFGLFNLRERLAMIGGKLNIKSEIGRGTSVTLFLPLFEEQSERYKLTT